MNNDFGVLSGAIGQWFSRSHEWKSLVNRITSEPGIVILGNACIILFLTRYFMSLIFFLKIIIDRSFHNCRQKRSFLTWHCCLTTVDLWSHANARYWHCDVIFVECCCTRKFAQRRSLQWITIVNINFSSPGIHGLACKKYSIHMCVCVYITCHFYIFNHCRYAIANDTK